MTLNVLQGTPKVLILNSVYYRRSMKTDCFLLEIQLATVAHNTGSRNVDERYILRDVYNMTRCDI